MEKGFELDLVIFTYVPPTTYFYGYKLTVKTLSSTVAHEIWIFVGLLQMLVSKGMVISTILIDLQ